MKKGFTLIELLAVIIILGLIALIAIPKIANVIEDAHKGAAETSAKVLLKVVKEKVPLSQLNGAAIYLNPQTGKFCKASDAVSETDIKTGCMKWYIFNDSEV